MGSGSLLSPRNGLLFAVIVAALAYLLIDPSSRRPEIVLRQGKVRGVTLERGDFAQQVEAFYRIPYAQPPVGELRFKRAQPVPDSNTTVYDSQTYGPRCPGKQLLAVPGASDDSEDCLTANIFRPANTSGQLMPVAVYFHGGAFNRGTAKIHDTASMVSHAAQPIVAVSFNYRLGALGFLNSAATAREGILNLGLWDQVLLLSWVQDNIRAFGGNPDDVTVMGLSAGAHSIGHHLLNGKSVFHKAITESGGATSRALHPPDSQLHEEQYQLFLDELNCTTVQCLRELPSSAVTAASSKVFDAYNHFVRWAWQPVIDNELVPGRTLDQNWPKNIAVITGFNHNEGTMYVPKDMSTPAQFDTFFQTLLPHVTERVAALYPQEEYIEWRPDRGEQYMRVEAAYGQYAYACPARQAAGKLGTSVFLYHWALNQTVAGGANHGDQMWYEAMDPTVRGISEHQDRLARTFHGYITDFIATGNPNGGGRPEWADFGTSRKTMVFGLGNDERAGGTGVGNGPASLLKDDWAMKQCEFWERWSRVYED
ncbi:Carboxylesterase 4A [Cyphellophora attinorum]|uniref:Carboxylic ester hydrolase n=1 Tax=Cyphellophora attinorum TaxID=1664694 RepID=A0A0N1H161_9EURO|nr:Carboxylesterase 4A [Phialophora attinorum]KPI34395.1 Carboxylesterase 4A [Phialophora attinorum]